MFQVCFARRLHNGLSPPATSARFGHCPVVAHRFNQPPGLAVNHHHHQFVRHQPGSISPPLSPLFICLSVVCCRQSPIAGLLLFAHLSPIINTVAAHNACHRQYSSIIVCHGSRIISVRLPRWLARLIRHNTVPILLLLSVTGIRLLANTCPLSSGLSPSTVIIVGLAVTLQPSINYGLAGCLGLLRCLSLVCLSSSSPSISLRNHETRHQLLRSPTTVVHVITHIAG